MLVLQILGVIAVLGFLYWGITSLNNWVYKKFKYDFFETGAFIIGVISTLLTYWGHKWYIEALTNQGDLLNGGIIMGIGVVGFFLLVVINIKRTNLIVGIIGSIIQITLFAIASFFVFYFVIMAAAWLLNTKPVYVLNQD